MVAGLCRFLGIHMGDKIDPDNNEDIDFLSHRGDRSLLSADGRRSAREAYISHALDLIDARNKKYGRWGWKDPLSNFYMRDVRSAILNPRIVCIMRDPVAVSTREIVGIREQKREITDEVILRQLDNCSAQQRDIIDLVLEWKVPALFVSYERALRHPRELALELAEFVGIPLEARELERLVRYIQPERNTADIASLYQGGGGRASTPAPSGAFLKVGNPGLPMGNEPLRNMVRKAEAALVGAEFDAAERFCHEALAAIATEVPLVADDPRTVDFDTLRQSLDRLPLTVVNFWYILGICHLQANGNPHLAHSLFLLTIKTYDTHPRFYLNSDKSAPFWSTLFHFGFSSLVIGETTAAINAFSRLLHSHALGLPLDSAAKKREGRDHEVYCGRATNLLGSLQRAAA